MLDPDSSQLNFEAKNQVVQQPKLYLDKYEA